MINHRTITITDQEREGRYDFRADVYIRCTECGRRSPSEVHALVSECEECDTEGTAETRTPDSLVIDYGHSTLLRMVSKPTYGELEHLALAYSQTNVEMLPNITKAHITIGIDGGGDLCLTISDDTSRTAHVTRIGHDNTLVATDKDQPEGDLNRPDSLLKMQDEWPEWGSHTLEQHTTHVETVKRLLEQFQAHGWELNKTYGSNEEECISLSKPIDESISYDSLVSEHKEKQLENYREHSVPLSEDLFDSVEEVIESEE